MHRHAQSKWNTLSSGRYRNVDLIESQQHKSYHHFYRNFYPKAIANVNHTVMLLSGQVSLVNWANCGIDRPVPLVNRANCGIDRPVSLVNWANCGIDRPVSLVNWANCGIDCPVSLVNRANCGIEAGEAFSREFLTILHTGHF